MSLAGPAASTAASAGNRMLLLVAYDGWEPDVEMGFTPAGRDFVRCNVRAAACRRVGDPHPWRPDAIVVRRD